MKKALMFACLMLFVVSTNAQVSKTVNPSQTQENKNSAEIKFEVESFDFGTIKQGDKVTYDFNFVNSGKEPLIISNATGTCGCTVPQWPKEPIAKGGKGTIHVEFNSAGKIGMQDKTVTISSNAKSSQVVLHLKGNVEATTPAKTENQSDKK
jgi:hypothetical protein